MPTAKKSGAQQPQFTVEATTVAVSVDFTNVDTHGEIGAPSTILPGADFFGTE